MITIRRSGILARCLQSAMIGFAAGAVLFAGGCKSVRHEGIVPAQHGPTALPNADWTAFTKLAISTAPAPVLSNPHFDGNTDGWDLPEGFSYDQAGGRNGTGCIRYDRTDPNVRPLIRAQVQRLIPGEKYHFGAWVRTENVKGYDSATVAFEFEENGKWVCGLYPIGIKGTTDWTLVGGLISAPDKPAQAYLLFYLDRGMTGTVWWDDAFVEPVAPRWFFYPIQPRRCSLTPGNGKIFFASIILGKFGAGGEWTNPAETVCRLRLQSGGQTVRELTVPALGERVVADFGDLPSGDYTLRAALADPKHRWLLADSELPLTVALPPDPASMPAHACSIDERGRAWVDGKPFLPVGLFFGGVQREDIDRLAGGPFNCVTPYDSLNLKFKDTAKEGIDATREVMDACHAKNIKILFSTQQLFFHHMHRQKSWCGETEPDVIAAKAVKAFRDHPALLAWYIGDEVPPEFTDALISRNQLVNRLDPYHPTWTLFYQFSDLPRYRNCSDVLGVDPYPIRDKESTRATLLADAMTGSERAIGLPQGMPLWVVPQIMNYGCYDPFARDNMALYKEKFRDPTETEMRSMALYMALRGAKGFVFYSYYDLLKPVAIGDFNRRWPEVCRVGQTMSDLAPFLLADEDGPAVTVTTIEGRVEAKAFSDGKGSIRVLVAGLGPGPARAEIVVPGQDGLKSKFGACAGLGGGRYRFEGMDICSDILETDRK